MLRRLPLREAVQALKTGEGSAPLPTTVRALTLRYVAQNSPKGPREFAATYAPRIAYANPSLPFSIERIRDPRSKSLDPKDPNANASWDGESKGSRAVPAGELIVQLADSSQTIPFGTALEVLKKLYEAAGAPADALAASTTREALDKGADVTYATVE